MIPRRPPDKFAHFEITVIPLNERNVIFQRGEKPYPFTTYRPITMQSNVCQKISRKNDKSKAVRKMSITYRSKKKFRTYTCIVKYLKDCYK